MFGDPDLRCGLLYGVPCWVRFGEGSPWCLDLGFCGLPCLRLVHSLQVHGPQHETKAGIQCTTGTELIEALLARPLQGGLGDEQKSGGEASAAPTVPATASTAPTRRSGARQVGHWVSGFGALI